MSREAETNQEAVARKVLVAVDGSSSSHRAVEYLGHLEAHSVRGLRVTLLYVMNPVPPFLREEAKRDTKAHQRLNLLYQRNLEQANQVLDASRQLLLDLGMDPGLISQKAHPRLSEPARDILFEAQQGLYDAVVLGRRGLSRAQEVFVGSVTNKVVQHAQNLPVWIVGGQVGGRDILCPVDGSEASLKAVDHLAFMVGDNPEVSITLFHAGASLRNYCPLDFNQEMAREIEGDLMAGDQRCMDDFYSRAQVVLAQAGLGPERVRTKVREGGLGVVKAIREEVAHGNYGTVVVGRTGQNRSFFMGHVADKVVSQCREVAVWVVG